MQRERYRKPIQRTPAARGAVLPKKRCKPGRVCRTSGCTTVLSIYNGEVYCRTCLLKRKGIEV